MDDLARTCERIASYSSRLKKVAILAEYLKPLDDLDLARATRFLGCGPIQSEDRKFSVGGATLRDAAIAATGWDAQTYAACHQQVGDTGETIGLLLHGKTQCEPMTLALAELIYARLYKMRRTADKVELLRETFCRHRPLTIKFFVKVITGNLRIGLLTKQVEEAIAAATGAPLEDVKSASNCAGDLPAVAVAARRGRLHEIEARLFHPMEFMLAKPLDDVTELSDPENYWVEDKYDGFRSQVHVDHGRVMIFTRGMEDVTHAFPEIAEAMKAIEQTAVIDGEILAWQDGRALSFNVLQQRIARRKLTADLAAEVPVAFVAYDLLFRDGRMIIDLPIEERRSALEEVVVNVAPQKSGVDLDTEFRDARERGNEGLVLKRRGSRYEPGKRTGAWLKVKRPYATLDVVVTAGEQGHGRRAIFLSDYTFGVRAADGFVNVGKAYSGLTDDEVRELTRRLRNAAVERFGRVVLVKPEIVLEVAFDGIQKSARHKGGYALRFPRIVRWRKDKKPEEADTIDRVRELYEESMVR
jgi:DNA ligase-1